MSKPNHPRTAPEAQIPLFAEVTAPAGGPTAPGPGGIRRPPDADARERAVDPSRNVLLEASAGTGKTSVLVARYVRLLLAGVDPANILALSFTRKAAAEMRERIVRDLRAAAAEGAIGPGRWRELRGRLGDVAIGTIDAFCLSLLREFPLEADLDPAFAIVDETEVPRLIDQALDRAIGVARSLTRDDADLALLFADLSVPQIKAGLAHLLERRLVAPVALHRFLAGMPDTLTADGACRTALDRLHSVLDAGTGGVGRFVADGPTANPRFRMLANDLGRLQRDTARPASDMRAMLDRLAAYFLTREGLPRTALTGYRKDDCVSPAAWARHVKTVAALAPEIKRVLDGLSHDLNLVLARAVRRLFFIALKTYRDALDAHAVVDFSEALERALQLLRQMDEFARSRYRLESRYQHVLVDEFQDTSRAQWELVSLLIRAWGEGLGLESEGPLPPSIFVVGDRKQSIYRFRDAEVAVLEEAARHIEALRPGQEVRHVIAHSFRAVPALLAFTNDLFEEVKQRDERADRFRYEAQDRFPLEEGIDAAPDQVQGGPVLGLAAADHLEGCAARLAAEITGLLASGTVRDREAGIARAVRPGDIAVLFRSRDRHREFEQALAARGVPTYVYKGLGFFDADEIKDVCVLLRYLARPASDLRAAALLRSRLVRLSDEGLMRLGPGIADAIRLETAPSGAAVLSEEDRRVLDRIRRSARAWLDLVDRMPPSDLVDHILGESAYLYELRGPGAAQARENLKKIRGLIRRLQNRGYATVDRVAAHIDRLSVGDESNAIVDAIDAVNLMTVHAAKGLEFPVVFLANVGRGTGGTPAPFRVEPGDREGQATVSVGSFQSAADADERLRDLEETKRLLYVAVTRARDRLYFAGVLRNGVMKPARGSLAEVLPASFLAVLQQAAAPGCPDQLAWTSVRATAHVLRVCREADASLPGPGPGARLETAGQADLDPVCAYSTSPRTTVRDRALDPPESTTEFDSLTDRLVGVLTHRLLQTRPTGGSSSVASNAELLLRAEERSRLDDPAAVVERAVKCHRSLGACAEFQDLLVNGRCLYELPFTLKPDGAELVRGVIDCLVQRPDGTIIVVELKTGAPRLRDEAQLALYVRAARHLFPEAPVEGLLVYAGESETVDLRRVEDGPRSSPAAPSRA